MKKFFLISLLMLTVVVHGNGQFIEDALRYSTQGFGVGARSIGMGAAYTGIADDFSAVYWNPAGLGQIDMNEVSLGLSHLSYGNTSTFLGSQQSFTNSTTSLNNIGLVYSAPTQQGSFVIALGYNRQSDFTTGLSIKGFNPSSSYIPSLANMDFNLAYELYLVDSVGYTPIVDSLAQKGKTLESGGVNNWTAALGVEVAKDLYLGASLAILSGSYSYNQEYNETDIYNKYSQARFGVDYAFSQLDIFQTIDGDISGFTARAGLLYKLKDRARIGLNVKIPSYYTIREHFSTDGTSVFDVPDINGKTGYSYLTEGQTEYDIVSPFVFTGGASVSFGSLLVAGDVEYTDWTQMEFRNIDPSLHKLNTDIKEFFRPTANLHLGAEYEFIDLGVKLRGGFAYLPSPYNGDPSSFDQKFVTGGIGFLIENSVAIDIGYAYGTWESYHQIYSGTYTSSETIHTHNLMTTVSYRY